MRNVSQSIFLRKEIAAAPLRKVVVGSACYTSIYVFDTKRRTTRFKVRKALNSNFVCVFMTNLPQALSCAKKIDRDPKVSKSPFKIDSIHQNDSMVPTRAREPFYFDFLYFSSLKYVFHFTNLFSIFSNRMQIIPMFSLRDLSPQSLPLYR